MSSAGAFTIQEWTGTERREIRLAGRALPQGNFELSGTMRAEVSYYPGNPIGVVQVLGAEEGESTVSGVWHDRYLGASAIATAAGPTLGSQVYSDCRALSQLFDDVRRKGQLLRVIWDEIIRFGVLVEFTQTWIRREDMEWALRFVWASQEDPGAVPAGDILVREPGQIEEAYIEQQRALAAVEDAMAAPPALSVAPSADALMAGLSAGKNMLENAADSLATLQGYMTTLEQTVDKQAAGYLEPFDAARRGAAILSSIANRGRALAENLAFDAQAATAPSAMGRPGLRIAALSWAWGAMRQARESVRQAIEREKASTWRTADQQIGVYVAVGGDDLRAVSRTFYGTPHEWRRLMTYNGLSSSLCTAGQVLLIPPLVEGGV